MKLHTHNTSGFSLIMAIGTVAFLLVIVTSLSILYLRESRLSRYTYDDILASSNAEGMFEYAMLKAKNHREWFEDIVKKNEPDGNLLQPTLDRSKNLQWEYSIVAASSGYTFDVPVQEHLIVPLFVSNEALLGGATTSKKPQYHTGSQNATDFKITYINGLDWTIVAMSGSTSIALTGNGNIDATTQWNIRIQASQCYHGNTGEEISCEHFDPKVRKDEKLIYFYDIKEKVSDFLDSKTDPYLVIYNSNLDNQEIRLTSSNPFSLPTLIVESKSQKWNSSQIFRFSEDKSKYYDALKYGVYNQ